MKFEEDIRLHMLFDSTTHFWIQSNLRTADFWIVALSIGCFAPKITDGSTNSVCLAIVCLLFWSPACPRGIRYWLHSWWRSDSFTVSRRRPCASDVSTSLFQRWHSSSVELGLIIENYISVIRVSLFMEELKWKRSIFSVNQLKFAIPLGWSKT